MAAKNKFHINMHHHLWHDMMARGHVTSICTSPCPTPSIANNLSAPTNTTVVDVDVHEVFVNVALRESPKCVSRSPPMYHPLHPCYLITWRRDAYCRLIASLAQLCRIIIFKVPKIGPAFQNNNFKNSNTFPMTFFIIPACSQIFNQCV